jgi:hypothetical protein
VLNACLFVLSFYYTLSCVWIGEKIKKFVSGHMNPWYQLPQKGCRSTMESIITIVAGLIFIALGVAGITTGIIYNIYEVVVVGGMFTCMFAMNLVGLVLIIVNPTRLLCLQSGGFSDDKHYQTFFVFPWWINFFNYALLYVVSAGLIAFVVYFGLSFTPSQGLTWVASCLVGIGFEVLIFKFLMIGMNVVGIGSLREMCRIMLDSSPKIIVQPDLEMNDLEKNVNPSKSEDKDPTKFPVPHDLNEPRVSVETENTGSSSIERTDQCRK